MDSKAFVQELLARNEVLLAKLDLIDVTAEEGKPQPGLVPLLRIALANEISVSELAAAWMPSTPEWEVKLALALQAGDEARHFKLVERRLSELGFSTRDFTLPGCNKLFEYLKGLESSVGRIAAGQVALESIAYRVNDRFMRYAEALGDRPTVEIYQKYIQPDEFYHQQLGQQLLEKYAATAEAQRQAREAATRTLELAAEVRTQAAVRIGTAGFPGC